jgi:hypothetical protein
VWHSPEFVRRGAKEHRGAKIVKFVASSALSSVHTGLPQMPLVHGDVGVDGAWR